MASNKKKAGKGSARDRAPRPRAQKAALKPSASAKTSRSKTPGARAKGAKPPVTGRVKTEPAGKASAALARPAARARSTAAVGAKRAAKGAQPLGPEPGLSEEDVIRSAKYTPRELPPRVFEEERFLFPETYGVNRVRLLVRDPEWLFAYWDVNPDMMRDMRKSLGERTLAVSRMTLRITDPVSGGSSDILLPPGARWWYVRADSTPRSYKAELGLTLPSGEFRPIAESNTVVTPRVGPSPQRARRHVRYGPEGAAPLDGEALGPDDLGTASPPGPWRASSIDGVAGPSGPAGARGAGDASSPGGASDTFRPGGASDVHRR